MKTVYFTDIKGFDLLFRGKVRDVYRYSDNSLFLVTTDRISAFDIVFPTPIPHKGYILAKITTFWFKKIKEEDILETHFITDEIPDKAPKYLEGRSFIVRRADVLPVECIVRFSLLGSAWREYKEKGTVHGKSMPKEMVYGQDFEEPIFTPSTKEKDGHDINIDFESMKSMVGSRLAEEMKEKSILISKYAKEYLNKKGIKLLDTKLEFGKIGDNLVLIDEIFTPDSSRFWVGKNQDFYDKEYLRQYLLSLRWDRKQPAPMLPKKIVQELKNRYNVILQRLNG